MKKLLHILVLLTPLLPGGLLHAVSLGDEFILSRLGDPVEIEIEVLQWEDINLERVQIVAASQREYDAFNLVWRPDIERLNFNLVGPDLDGEVRVLVSSRDPFTEPFLELLLILRWPGGSLLREYVLLFDPPGTVAASSGVAQPTEAVPNLQAEFPIGPSQESPTFAPPLGPEPEPAETLAPIAEIVVETANEIAAETVAVPTEQELVGQPVTERADVRAQQAIEVETLAVAVITPVPAPASERRTYQVRPGDNLWDIARQFLPAGTGDNLYQMLLSIHNLNRRGFINGNISLLRANALLELPTRDDIESVDPVTAQIIFDQRWDEGTRRFEAAQRGEALPVFGGLAPPAPIVEEIPEVVPALPPGKEAPTAADQQTALIMVDSNNALQPLPDIVALVDGTQAASEPVSASPIPLLSEVPPLVVVVERSDRVPASQEFQVLPNLSLERITASAAAVEQLLSTRQQRLEQVQLQLLALRQRVEQARAMAAGVEGRAGNAVQGQDNMLMLVLLTALLTLALVGALVLVLREAARLRRSEQMLALNPMTGYRAGNGRVTKSPIRMNAGNKDRHPPEEDALMAELEDLLAPGNCGIPASRLHHGQFPQP